MVSGEETNSGVMRRGYPVTPPVYRQRFEHIIDLALAINGGTAASLSLLEADQSPHLLAYSGYENVHAEVIDRILGHAIASDEEVIIGNQLVSPSFTDDVNKIVPGGKLLVCLKFDVRGQGTGILCLFGSREDEPPDDETIGNLIRMNKLTVDLMNGFLSESAGKQPLGASMRGLSVPNLRLPSGHIETEEGLRELIQLFQLILDNIPQAVFWKDLDSIYLGCNYNFAFDAGVGVTANIVGKTDFDLAWREEHAAAFVRDDQEVMRSGRPIYHIIEPQLQADGKVAWLETNKIPLLDSDGEVVGLLGTYEDITERKNAEEELRRSQQMLRLVLDNIPQKVFWKDTNSVYAGCNRTFALGGGLESPDEIIGKTDFDLPWADAQGAGYIRDDQTVMSTGKPLYHINELQLQADGSVLWFDTNKVPLFDAEDNVVGVLGTSEDITERKLAEEELKKAREELEIRVLERTQELSETNLKLRSEIRERSRVEEALLLSRERYALAVNAGKVGVWEWNVHTDELYLDPSLKAMLGISSEKSDIRFGDWMVRVDAEDRDSVRVGMRSFWSGQLPIYEQEYRIITDNTEPRWVLARGTALSDETGKLLRMTGSVTDITALKEAENALQRRDVILEALTYASQHLLAPEDLTEGLAEALSQLGEAVGFSRAFLLKNEHTRYGDLRAVCSSFWGGLDSSGEQREAPIASFDYQESGLEEWVPILGGGDPVHGLAEGFPSPVEGFLKKCGVRSFIWVPVFSGGSWWGILGFDTSTTERVCLPAEIDALKSAASALGSAFAQQKSREAEREQRTLAEALRDTAALLNSTLNVNEVLDRILSEIGRVVSHDNANIILVDGEMAHIVRSLVTDTNEPDRLELGKVFPLADLPNLRYMIETKKPLIIQNTLGHPRWIEKHPEQHRINSYIGTPILIEEDVIGFISLNSTTVDFFKPSHAERLKAFSNQAAAAIRNAQLYEQAQDLAAMEERQRLARDLHDAVSQTLWTANIIADVLPTIWVKDQDMGEDSLEKLRRLTRGALAEMRTLLLELRPTALMESSLPQLLNQLAATTMSRKKLDISLQAEGKIHLPPDVQVGIYRIAQETLNNIAKHSYATHVEIGLKEIADGLELHIRDDGRGFNLTDLPSDRLGMNIMRERAESIGAELKVKSTIGQGTEVIISWIDKRV